MGSSPIVSTMDVAEVERLRRGLPEVRDLVQNEWLPKEMLTAKVQAFDFVGDGLLSTIAALKPKLRAVVRTVAREVLKAVAPEEMSGFLARVAKRPLDAKQMAPFLADLVRRGREDRWLEPVAADLARLNMRPIEIGPATAQGLAPGLSEGFERALLTREDWRVDAPTALAAIARAAVAAGAHHISAPVKAKGDEDILVVATGVSVVMLNTERPGATVTTPPPATQK